MEGLINIILEIFEIFSNIFTSKNNKKEELLPFMPGELYIIIVSLILSSLLAILLHNVIKINNQLYITLSIIFVYLFTAIILIIIRKVYFTLTFNRLKRKK
jgi:cobalamin biosynthesis protein CobD/CbiB